MVRPRKGEGLLSERVVFRLRPEEVAGLTWAADQAGMHPADLTRALLRAALVAPMSEQSRTNFLGANVARVYGLS